MGVEIKNITVIEKVIKRLEGFKLDIDGMAQRFAELAKDTLIATYPSYSGITVTTERMSEGVYEISANGKEVCFIEFGAGFYADPNHPNAKDVSFSVYPGSYSVTHRRTFQKHLADGKPPEDYYWNIEPIRAFPEATRVVIQAMEDSFKEMKE